jgi:hypothetical protein
MSVPGVAAPTAVVDRAMSVATDAWLWPVAATAAVGAGLELVVLRIFTRTIIHIPGASGVSPVLEVTADIGRFTYYLSCVLLIVTIALLLVASATAASTRAMVGAAAIATFATAAIGARVGAVGHDTAGAAALAAAVVLGLVATRTLERRAQIPVVAFSGAFALAAFDELAGEGFTTAGGGTELRLVAEVLAVVAAVTSPLLLRVRPDRRSIGIGLLAGVVVVAMLTANSWTITILMLWNFGLAGTLPWVLYGAAFGALSCTFVSLIRDGDRERAIALALLFAGGIGLHSTYQTGLVIAGLALLGSAARTWDSHQEPDDGR